MTYEQAVAALPRVKKMLSDMQGAKVSPNITDQLEEAVEALEIIITVHKTPRPVSVERALRIVR